MSWHFLRPCVWKTSPIWCALAHRTGGFQARDISHFQCQEYIDAIEEMDVLARFINDCRNPAATPSQPANWSREIRWFKTFTSLLSQVWHCILNIFYLCLCPGVQRPIWEKTWWRSCQGCGSATHLCWRGSSLFEEQLGHAGTTSANCRNCLSTTADGTGQVSGSTHGPTHGPTHGRTWLLVMFPRPTQLSVKHAAKASSDGPVGEESWFGFEKPRSFSTCRFAVSQCIRLVW